jgi:hypothetical protein
MHEIKASLPMKTFRHSDGEPLPEDIIHAGVGLEQLGGHRDVHESDIRVRVIALVCFNAIATHAVS